ncbi:MAG: hypothetical protein PVI00_16135, partial [Desulfobacterales bacterium]
MKTRTAFSTFIVRYENLFLLCLALLAILVYAHTLNNPFIFDDKPNIVSNPHIRISDLSLERLSDAAFKSPAPQRPLPNISFALNY